MKKKRWRWFLLFVLLVGAVTCWLADRGLKSHGHPGLVTFTKQWWRNYPKSFAMEPPVISIKVDDAGMERLEGVVERSRQAGVVVQEGNEYVPGEFLVEMPGGGEGTGEFNGRLRIKGKMTDHVEGTKWSFRVVAKKSGGFLGMKRFSLQHPGTRNYLCDWFYHQLMRGEGLIALRYGFCKVKLNEEDLGVYAYEEHFGPELLENNGRLAGPIVRFEPGLFWLHRTQGLDGSVSVADAYGAYQAANLDAFDSNDIAKDAQQKKYFEQALALVQGFRRGELKASEVFDVERTGKRLALLDLVGGHHSMDWSDVKFYFDPIAQRLEPISYESFSAFPTKELAGAYKATGPFRESDDLHTAFFKGPEVSAAYVRELERISGKAWLDSAFAALKGPLDTASATLYGEFPYKELDRGIYYANQKAIRKLLHTPKAFHAYAQGVRADTLTLLLQPIEALPSQVDHLLLESGRSIPLLTSVIVPARERGKVGRPVEVRFPGVAGIDSTMKVSYHVLGSKVAKEVEVFPFKLSVSAAQDELLVGMKPNAHEFAFIVLNEAARTLTIKPGAWNVDRTMVLPAGYRCMALAPLKLDIMNGAEIISYASLEWKGMEDMSIEVFSTDSSSHGVHVIGAGSTSELSHVEFRDLTRYKYDQERSGDVSFHASPVDISSCWFHGTGSTLLDISVTNARITNCAFGGGSDQLETHFAEVDLEGCVFGGANDDAISCEGGVVNLKGTEVRGAAGIAVKGSKGARIQAEALEVKRSVTAFEGREGARLFINDGSVAGVELIADAKKKEMRYGPVKIDLKNVIITNAKEDYKCGEGSVIMLDGKRVGGAKAANGT